MIIYDVVRDFRVSDNLLIKLLLLSLFQTFLPLRDVKQSKAFGHSCHFDQIKQLDILVLLVVKYGDYPSDLWNQVEHQTILQISLSYFGE